MRGLSSDDLSAKGFFKLWMKSWPTIMLFGIIFTGIVHYGIIPVGKRLMTLVYYALGVQHLSNENIKVLLQPTVATVTLFAMFAVGLLVIFELYAYVRLGWVSNTHPLHRTRMTIAERIRTDFAPLIRPAFLLYGPLLLLMLGIYGVSFSSTITSSFKVPEFILETIKVTPRYHAIYIVGILLLSYFALRSCFWIHGLTIGHLGPYAALKQSWRMTRFKWHIHLLYLIKGHIFIGMGIAFIYVLVLPASLGLGLLLEKTLSLSGQVITAIIGGSRLSFFLAAVVYRGGLALWLGRMYEKNRGLIDTIIVKPIPLAERTRLIRLHDKLSRHPLVITLAASFAVGLCVLQWIFIYSDVSYSSLPLSVQRPILITAHRGSFTEAPENTLVALERAMRNKADMAEIDVQLTADKKVVLFHDDTLQRLAGAPGKIADYSLEELQRFEVGSHLSEEFRGVPIPTLEEALELTRSKIKLNIELKPQDGNVNELAEAVYALLLKHGMQHEVELSSLNEPILKKMDELDSSLQLGYILAVAVGNFDDKDFVDFYSIEASFATPTNIARVHLRGKQIAVWTVNSERELKTMRDREVDNVITDDPLLARKVLTANPFEQTLVELLLAS